MNRARDLFLFRLNRLASLAGQPLVRLCEGKYGITRREWRLIVVLAQDGPLLSTELARRASIEAALTSRTITLLVEAGLATRVPRANDRRFIEIHLTERAREIFASLYPTVVSLNERLLSGLSPADIGDLDRLFKLLEEMAPTLAMGTELPKANRRRAKT
jgi:DNA-binding MarR family transcriptional regulator